MGNTQYVITYIAQNGARSTWNTWANSESQATVEFNNWIREQKRCFGASNGNPNWGDICDVREL